MTTLVLSILNGSSSFLHTIRTTIKASMGLNFTDFGVSFPWASEKFMINVVTTLAPSSFIESSSFLQATRKLIISRMGSKFSRIRPGTYELPALESSEKSP